MDRNMINLFRITKKFQTIYADPPWSYCQHQKSTRGVSRQYSTLTLDAICELGVDAIVDDTAILFLWTTAPQLPVAMKVIDAWGFVYKTGWVWDKVLQGMGFYGRVQHEHLLIGTRGKIKTPNPRARPRSVLTEKRTSHSTKPLEVRLRIEKMYPDHSRIELFARGKPVSGWTFWGDEVDLF